MHQISEVLKWPSVTDLYPHIGMLPDGWGYEEHPTTAKKQRKSGGSALVVGAGVHSSSAAVLTTPRHAQRVGAAAGLTTAPDGNHGDNR